MAIHKTVWLSIKQSLTIDRKEGFNSIQCLSIEHAGYGQNVVTRWSMVPTRHGLAYVADILFSYWVITIRKVPMKKLNKESHKRNVPKEKSQQKRVPIRISRSGKFEQKLKTLFCRNFFLFSISSRAALTSSMLLQQQQCGYW